MYHKSRGGGLIHSLLGVTVSQSSSEKTGGSLKTMVGPRTGVGGISGDKRLLKDADFEGDSSLLSARVRFSKAARAAQPLEESMP